MEVNLATMQQFHEMVLRVCSQYPISIPAMIRSNKRYLEAHHDISIVSESDSFFSAHSREMECLQALHQWNNFHFRIIIISQFNGETVINLAKSILKVFILMQSMLITLI